MMKTRRAMLIVSMFCGVGCTLPVSQQDVLSELTHPQDDGGCVPRQSINDWPVKVLFLVENRGSLCVLDPPGSTGARGFCEMFTQADGGTVPGRVKALEQFWASHAAQTNLWSSVTWWNPGERGFSFRPVSGGLPMATGAELTHALGAAGDLEGALRLAKQRLEAEMQATSPSLRAQTKFEVVMLSVGVPTPICSSNDDFSTFPTPTNPQGRWPDSPGSGDFCNFGNREVCDPVTGRDPKGGVCLPGFVAGGDRNQPAALMQLATEIAQLKAAYGVGAVSLHSRMLFDQGQLDACGPVCNDLLGLPGRDASIFGEYILRSLATAGGGTFVRPATPQQLDLSDVDVTTVREVCAQ